MGDPSYEGSPCFDDMKLLGAIIIMSLSAISCSVQMGKPNTHDGYALPTITYFKKDSLILGQAVMLSTDSLYNLLRKHE